MGEAEEGNSTLLNSIGLIVGLSVVGITLVIITAFSIRYCYKKHKWNQYIKQLYGNKVSDRLAMALFS